MTSGARSLDGVGRIAGLARPEYGPDLYDLVCDQCGAGWVGPDGEACGWCAVELERLVEDQRWTLLWPDWLTVDHGPRYDQFEPDDRAVWDRTRGRGGTGSMATWVERLARAVESGLITEQDAQRATQRITAA